MKNVLTYVLIFIFVISCKTETPLTFTEVNQLHSEGATIEINIPKAEGDQVVSTAINSAISRHIANELNFGEDSTSISLDEAIVNFETEYKRFKNDFQENPMVWEASFDGEVIYQSEALICLALTSYSFTGGAHGNMNITLYNFDTTSGKSLAIEELISDIPGFTKLAHKHFVAYLESEGEAMDNYFFGEDFHLPANIGFNEDGVILLYNTYEIASYADGMTEFIIPLDEAEPHLMHY